MKRHTRRIPGCGRYTIDLITHEIYNGRGKQMTQYIDARGRLTVQLTCEVGQQKNIVVRDLVRKMGVSVGIKEASASNEDKVILVYYHSISDETISYTLQQWAKLVQKEVQALTIIEVGRILNKLRTLAT